ncbi:MAG: DNA-binding protein [Deltaproteobacteria bacterium]|nr:DNA-binding protein [Deltaproteobacteria bacterium]
MGAVATAKEVAVVLVAVSRKGRSIMGRLDRGDSLIDSLLQVCRKYSVRSAEIRGLGAFQEVELTAYDQSKGQYLPPHRFAGNLEILSLVGNVTEKDGDLFCHLHATIARDTDNGLQVLGGHVKQGTVFACEFVLDTLDDVILRRKVDRKTGLGLWQDKIELRPEPAEGSDGQGAGQAAGKAGKVGKAGKTGKAGKVGKAGKTGKAGNEFGEQAGGASAGASGDVTWDDVLQATLDRTADPDEAEGGADGADGADGSDGDRDAADTSASVEAADGADDSGEEDDDWIEPEAGDLLIHPKFGRGLIEGVEDGEFLHVRLKNNRTVRLSLDVIRLNLLGYEEGHQVFEARLIKE